MPGVGTRRNSEWVASQFHPARPTCSGISVPVCGPSGRQHRVFTLKAGQNTLSTRIRCGQAHLESHLLASLASRATRALHKPNNSVEETLNEVLRLCRTGRAAKVVTRP